MANRAPHSQVEEDVRTRQWEWLWMGQLWTGGVQPLRKGLEGGNGTVSPHQSYAVSLHSPSAKDRLCVLLCSFVCFFSLLFFDVRLIEKKNSFSSFAPTERDSRDKSHTTKDWV